MYAKTKSWITSNSCIPVNDSSSGSDSGSDSDDESGNENNQNSSQGQYTDNQYSAQEPFDENSMNNRTQ